MSWPLNYAPFTNNHNPILSGLNATTQAGSVPVAVDPATGAVLTEIVSSVTPSLPASVVSGQTTVTGTATALASHSLTQGVIVEALSSNTVSVFVGPSGVTTSTGLELPPGAAVSIPVSNSSAVYVICATSSPVITFVGN